MIEELPFDPANGVQAAETLAKDVIPKINELIRIVNSLILERK